MTKHMIIKLTRYEMLKGNIRSMSSINVQYHGNNSVKDVGAQDSGASATEFVA